MDKRFGDRGLPETVMNNPKSWLRRKLSAPCICKSGRDYRDCCYHREGIYFVVGVFAGLCLFGAGQWPAFLIGLPVLLLIALATKVHFDRKRRVDNNRRDVGNRI